MWYLCSFRKNINGNRGKTDWIFELFADRICERWKCSSPCVVFDHLNVLHDLKYRDKIYKKRKFKIEYEMLAVGVLFYWISLSVQIVNRIPYYFTGSVMTILPNLIVEMKNRKQAKIVNICVIVFLVLYEFLMIARSAQGIMPYQFFWE